MNAIVELLIELILLVIMIIFVAMGADTRFIIEVATLYLAAVIRHTGRNAEDDDWFCGDAEKRG